MISLLEAVSLKLENDLNGPPVKEGRLRTAKACGTLNTRGCVERSVHRLSVLYVACGVRRRCGDRGD
jgi:hypothetical protein